VATVTARIEILLFTLSTNITINGFGVVVREIRAMEMLIYCWLVTLSFECGGVKSGCTSDADGVRGFRRKDEGM